MTKENGRGRKEEVGQQTLKRRGQQQRQAKRRAQQRETGVTTVAECELWSWINWISGDFISCDA